MLQSSHPIRRRQNRSQQKTLDQRKILKALPFLLLPFLPPSFPPSSPKIDQPVTTPRGQDPLQPREVEGGEGEKEEDEQRASNPEDEDWEEVLEEVCLAEGVGLLKDDGREDGVPKHLRKEGGRKGGREG